MKRYLSTLRPVGNAILTRNGPLDYGHFGNMDIRFYQSGTAALAASLIATMSLHKNVTNRPEVILPAYACPDLVSACVFAGGTPVLVDLEPDSCWMSLEQIEHAITKNTIGLIAVRFLGITERMKQLQNICERHNLILIEDSAQGFPASHPESYWEGDLAILSFGRGKPINLLGGGAILIRNTALINHLPDIKHDIKVSQAEKFKYWSKIRAYNLLITPPIYSVATQLPGLHIGETTYKNLAELKGIRAQALAYMNANITQYKQHRQIANKIHQRLSTASLDDIIDLPEREGHDYMDPLLRYPILLINEELRDKLFNALQRFGASTMYQKPLYQIDGIPEQIKKHQPDTPNAENFAKRLLTLPTHSAVTDKILDQITSILTRISG